MKIALSHWQGRISPVFDVSEKLVLIDLEQGQVIHRQEVFLTRGDPFGRAMEITRLAAEILVCGAISHSHEKALIQLGIQVTGFTCGDLDTVIAAVQEDRLAEACFRMPGYEKPGAESGLSGAPLPATVKGQALTPRVRRRRRKVDQALSASPAAGTGRFAKTFVINRRIHNETNR